MSKKGKYTDAPKALEVASKLPGFAFGHPRKIWHGEDPNRPVKGKFGVQTTFGSHDPLYADYTRHVDDKRGRLYELEDRSTNPLVLDSHRKFKSAWKESGAERVPGNFHPHKTHHFADWARKKGHDAVVLSSGAFDDPAGDTDEHNAANVFGEPQTLILNRRAVKVKSVKD